MCSGWGFLWLGLWEWVPELVKDAAGDREMAEMAAEEVNMLEEQAEELEEGLKVTNLASSNGSIKLLPLISR